MKYEVRQNGVSVEIDASQPVEITCNGITKEIDGLALLQAPNLAAAIASVDADKARVAEAHKAEIDKLQNKLGMMAVVFKSITKDCAFEKIGDRYRGLFFVKPRNEDLELAFNIAQQVDLEQAFMRLMNSMQEGEPS